MPERKPDKILTIKRPSRITAGDTVVDVSWSPRGLLVLKIWSSGHHIRIDKPECITDNPDCSFVEHD